MSSIGRPRKGFNVVSYNKQKADRLCKRRAGGNVTERLLNEAAEWIGSTLEQPADPRAWDQLLIYAPREAIERRLIRETPASSTSPALPDDAKTALQTAINHLEHMAQWIVSRKDGYHFEALGEDMPGIRAAYEALGGKP